MSSFLHTNLFTPTIHLKTQAVFCAVLCQQEKNRKKENKQSQTARWHGLVRRAPAACHAKGRESSRQVTFFTAILISIPVPSCAMATYFLTQSYPWLG